MGTDNASGIVVAHSFRQRIFPALGAYTHANEDSIKRAGDIFRKAIGEG